MSTPLKKMLKLNSEYLPVLTEAQLIAIENYFMSLVRDGSKLGLIAQASESENQVRHILDCLIPFAPIQNHLITQTIEKSEVICDLGSGAGLPGIILKILFPEKKIFLIDSNKKKCQFLLSQIHKLALTNIQVLNQRVEDVNLDDQIDLIINRAFARPLAMLELSKYIFAKNKESRGYILYWRSRNFETQLNDMKLEESYHLRLEQLGYSNGQFIALKHPEIMNSRSIFFIESSNHCQSTYPRSWKKIKSDKLVAKVV